MPLHEYLCDACGHQFEVIQKFSDPPVEVCPKCGGRVQKQLSSPAIHFKGTGWYITDYAKKGAGAETSKSDGKGADKPAEKAGEKSDSTPASGDAASTGDKAGSTPKSDSSSKT